MFGLMGTAKLFSKDQMVMLVTLVAVLLETVLLVLMMALVAALAVRVMLREQVALRSLARNSLGSFVRSCDGPGTLEGMFYEIGKASELP